MLPYEEKSYTFQQMAPPSLSKSLFTESSLSWQTVCSLNQLKSCLNCNVKLFTYDFKVTCKDVFSM